MPFTPQSSLLMPFSRDHLAYREYNAILGSLHRRTELEYLKRWAKKKGFAAPLNLYTNRHLDEERRLAMYAMRSPNIYFWARVAQLISFLVSPKTPYTKGYAAKYRYR